MVTKVLFASCSMGVIQFVLRLFVLPHLALVVILFRGLVDRISDVFQCLHLIIRNSYVISIHSIRKLQRCLFEYWYTGRGSILI